MPEELIKQRGGAKYWRTKVLPNGEYIHVAITKRAGPRGGRTVSGPIHRRLKA